MSRVFADTFYSLALLHRRDPAHPRALAACTEPASPVIVQNAFPPTATVSSARTSASCACAAWQSSPPWFRLRP
jgi:hypothetical protein